jgi:hypothetical protein
LQQLVQDKWFKDADGEILPGDHVIADVDLDRGELVFEKGELKTVVN